MLTNIISINVIIVSMFIDIISSSRSRTCSNSSSISIVTTDTSVTSTPRMKDVGEDAARGRHPLQYY